MPFASPSRHRSILIIDPSDFLALTASIDDIPCSKRNKNCFHFKLPNIRHKYKMKILSVAIVLSSILGLDAFAGNTRDPPLLVGTRLNMAPSEGVSRRNSLLSIAVASGFLVSSQPASARLESVNRPDLLPSEKGLNVIQTEKLLTSGQAKRMDSMLASLEKDTGFRVRVLCQNYPNTPGLAIRDYWDLGKEVSPYTIAARNFSVGLGSASY